MCKLFIHETKLKSIALLNVFLLITLMWILQLGQGFKRFKMDQKNIYNVSNILLAFKINLKWHHFNYRHIRIHYNYKAINVIKI